MSNAKEYFSSCDCNTNMELPNGLLTTNNIFGYNLKLSPTNPDDTIIISKGSCMDELNINNIVLDNDIPLTITTTADTIYNIFITKTGETVSPMVSTYVDGSDLTVNYKRWLGFVRTDSNSEIVPFIHYDNTIEFLYYDSIVVLTANTGTANDFNIPIENFVPIEKVFLWYPGAFNNISDSITDYAEFFIMYDNIFNALCKFHGYQGDSIDSTWWLDKASDNSYNDWISTKYTSIMRTGANGGTRTGSISLHKVKIIR